MNRRYFFKAGLATAATSSLLGNELLASHYPAARAASKKKIGIQLYSLRGEMAKDPDATLKDVAKIGYSAIEGYGYYEGKFFGKSPEEIRKQILDLGMEMTSSHTGFRVYRSDTTQAWDNAKKNMEDTKKAGCKWIVQAGIYPGINYTKLDEVKKLADMFNRIGELAKSFGLKFAYHNHREEFRAIEEEIPYQVCLELTEKELVTFQMDVGHVASEMADYRSYLKLYPGRFGCLHVRDTNVFTKTVTELGKGQVAIEDVFNLFANAGVEDYYVEQEEHNYAPLESLKMCYDYLAAAKFVTW